MARKKKEKTVEELRAEFFAREQKAYDERMKQAEAAQAVETVLETEDSDDTDETEEETENSEGEK